MCLERIAFKPVDVVPTVAMVAPASRLGGTRRHDASSWPARYNCPKGLACPDEAICAAEPSFNNFPDAMKVRALHSIVKEPSFAATAGEALPCGASRSPKPTATKSNIAGALCSRTRLNRREAQELTDAFFDIVRAALEKGENVSLSSFGAFRLREKGPRAGRDPRTGKPVPIKARRVVTFFSSRTLRARIDRG